MKRLVFLFAMAVLAGGALSAQNADAERRKMHDAATNSEIETFMVNGVAFKMVKVAGGTFQMGATSEQGNDVNDDEYPVHSVTLSDYYIGQTQVTQELWEAVMGGNPSFFTGDNQCPVALQEIINVLWKG